nr:hypothetical protein BaRGS_014137 [Batillaria attramentaria]
MRSFVRKEISYKFHSVLLCPSTADYLNSLSRGGDMDTTFIETPSRSASNAYLNYGQEPGEDPPPLPTEGYEDYRPPTKRDSHHYEVHTSRPVTAAASDSSDHIYQNAADTATSNAGKQKKKRGGKDNAFAQPDRNLYGNI